MKKRIFGVLLLLMIFVGTITLCSVFSSAVHPFKDVPEWADKYVDEVYTKGIMNGTDIAGKIFDPNGSLTREQLLVTLYRMSGAEVTGTRDLLSATFVDGADISDWAVNAISWAVKEKITEGVKQGNDIYFKPQAVVTHQETAKFLITFIDYMKLEAPTDNTDNIKDLASVDTWALPYVERCIAAGIISGDSNGYIYPKDKTLRITAAKMLSSLPEENSGIIHPNLKIVSRDKNDFTPASVGKVSFGDNIVTENIEISQAVVLKSNGYLNQFTATAIGVHGWHETRIVRTEYGTYAVFAQNERLGDSYEAYSSTPENPCVNTEIIGKFYLVKITKSGFDKVLEGEFPVHNGSCAPNVLAGKDGMLYVTTFSEDKDTYYGSLDRTANPVFTAEGAFLTVYEFDTKTDTLVTSTHEVLNFKKIGVHGYGYYQPVLDLINGKLYAFFSGGQYPGYFSWFTYDLNTHQWDDTNYLVETKYRCSYFHAYADGNGGIFFLAQANPHSSALENFYKNELNSPIQFSTDGYIFDSIYLYRIPDMTKEKIEIAGVVYTPDYLDRKTFSATDGLITPAIASYYSEGTSYLASNGYLYVIYNYKTPKNSEYMFVVYDTNDNFKKVRGDEKLILRSNENAEYQFAITETLNGSMYLWAVATQFTDAEFELYKLDINAPTINSPVIQDFDGNPGYVSINYKGTNDEIGHARLSYTTTRNYSIQDNVLGILSWEYKNSERTTSLRAEGFDESEHSTVQWSGTFETKELFYYTIKFPE